MFEGESSSASTSAAAAPTCSRRQPSSSPLCLGSFYFVPELWLPPAVSLCPTGSRGAHSIVKSLVTVLQDGLRGCFSPPPASLQHPLVPPGQRRPPPRLHQGQLWWEAPEPGGRAGQDGAARLGVRWRVQKRSFPRSPDRCLLQQGCCGPHHSSPSFTSSVCSPRSLQHPVGPWALPAPRGGCRCSTRLPAVPSCPRPAGELPAQPHAAPAMGRPGPIPSLAS